MAMITDLFRFICGAVCHQMPSRSFFVDGMPLPLCSRCTGMYISLFVCSVWIWMSGRRRGNKPFSVGVSVFTAVCFLPLAIDGVTSYLNIRETNNLIRFVTGVLFAAMLPAFYTLLINFMPDMENEKPIIKRFFEPVLVILAACSALLLIYFDGTVSWFVLSFILTGSVLFPFYGVIRVVCQFVLKRFIFKRKSVRFYHYTSLAFSVVAVMFFSVLHKMIIDYILLTT